MKLIVGLGNPGDKYAATRHNAGFWFVERLAASHGTALRKDGKFQALVGRLDAGGAWLVLPQSYMNSSGRPLQMMASFFRIEPADVLVVHDELDLPPGAARIKQGGGVAGHNGLKDISARLGTHDYWRLRLGIGRPADRAEMADYVLHRPAQEERAAIDDAITRALDVLPLVLAGDMQGAMLRLHTEAAPQAQPPAAGEGNPAREKPVRGNAPRRGRKAPDPQPEPAAAPGGTRAPDPAPQAESSSGGPVPAPVVLEARDEAPARASTIERFGSAARPHIVPGAPPASEEVAPGAPPPLPAPAPDPVQPAKKKGAFGTLLDRLRPGGDPARRK